MAKRKTRPKFLLKFTLAAGLIYAGISLIHPIRFATKYYGRDIGPTIRNLENIIQGNNIPPKHADGLTFVKLHEDYFRHRAATYAQSQGIIFIPDNDRNRPNFPLTESFAEDICHEIAHHAYSTLPMELKSKWNQHTLDMLDADLRLWGYIAKLKKSRQEAFRNEEKAKVKSLDHQISTLYGYSTLPAGFDQDFNVVIDIEKTKEAFDPEELFTQTYADYLTGSYIKSQNERKQRRIELGMEKPELESMWEERMRLMGEIISQERDNTFPLYRLLDSRANFPTIWLRYLHPSPIRTFKSIAEEYNSNTRIKELCARYLKRDNYVESKN